MASEVTDTTATNEPEPTPGRIITFYSYKGGTGRSMALANVAWLLAMAGKQVLVVDWDLEAPGLHRYFHPFLKDKELRGSEGIIDWVIEFEDAATARLGKERDDRWYLPYANILRYATSLDYDFPPPGTLDFIPAGRQSSSYATRVNSFDFGDFYEKLGGWALMEEARRRMLEEYEYVLVDSRTGVSDTAGICTVQLPDDLVVCYTLNTQSIEGASAVAASVVEQRRKRPDRPLRVYPVAMRVEKAEKDKREARRAYARAKFFPFLTGMQEDRRERLWGDSVVPYDAYYAYEELLAYFKEKPAEAETMLVAMRRLATLVAGKPLTIPDIDSSEQERVLKQYAAVGPEPQPADAVAKQEKSGVYCSAAPADLDAANALGFLVRGRLPVQILRPEAASSGSATPSDIWNALGSSRAAMILLGPHGSGSVQYRELALAMAWRTEEERRGGTFPIVPVLLPGAALDPPPGLLARFPPVDLRDSRTDDRAVEPLVAAIEDRKSDAERQTYPPYRGLFAYGELDAPLFFGRELIANVIAQRLNTSSVVVLSGPPGEGKTSLVFGGILPLLRQQRPPDRVWSITVTDWHVASLVDDPGTEPGTTHLYVVEHIEPSMLPALRTAVTLASSQHAWLLLVDGDPGSVPLEWSVRFQLEPLSADDRRRIVQRPAAAAGRELEPGLVGRIVEDTASAPLPAVSLAMHLLWQARRGRTLTHEGWQAIGPIDGVIGRWADAALARVPEPDQRAAQSFLVRLLRPSGLGNAIAWRDLEEPDRRLAHTLATSGLVVVDRDGHGHEAAVRLPHPTVAQHWPRLRDRVEQRQEFLQWRERTTPMLRQWQGRPARYLLLTGDDLAAARRWVRDHADELTEAERRYIDASTAHDSTVRSQREKDVESQKRLQWQAAGIGVVLLIAVVVIVVMTGRRSEEADAAIQAASRQIAQKDYQGAIRTLDAAPATVWTDARAHAVRGQAKLLARDAKGAEEDYRRAIEIDPTNVDLYKGLAYAFKLQQDLALATAQYDRILGTALQPGLAPNDAQTLKDRAFARRAQNDLAGATADYEAALKIDAADRQTQADLAYARRLQAQETGRGFPPVRARVPPRGGIAEALLGFRIVIYVQEGRPPDAERALRLERTLTELVPGRVVTAIRGREFFDRYLPPEGDEIRYDGRSSVEQRAARALQSLIRDAGQGDFMLRPVGTETPATLSVMFGPARAAS